MSRPAAHNPSRLRKPSAHRNPIGTLSAWFESSFGISNVSVFSHSFRSPARALSGFDLTNRVSTAPKANPQSRVDRSDVKMCNSRNLKCRYQSFIQNYGIPGHEP
jgi:hypothetical protein